MVAVELTRWSGNTFSAELTEALRHQGCTNITKVRAAFRKSWQVSLSSLANLLLPPPLHQNEDVRRLRQAYCLVYCCLIGVPAFVAYVLGSVDCHHGEAAIAMLLF